MFADQVDAGIRNQRDQVGPSVGASNQNHLQAKVRETNWSNK
jgi:hypothetical protein